MLVAERLADWAIRIWEGDKTVAAELKKIIFNLEETDYGFVGNNAGVNAGIQYGLDPVNALVQLGFMLFGQFWPFLDDFKQANKIIRDRWREKLKQAETKNSNQSNLYSAGVKEGR